MRKSTLYLSFVAACLIALVLLVIAHPLLNAHLYATSVEKKKQLVQKLGITDLCLFTEARYTRHLSQADLYSAFQDHPMSFEHFPSGSLTLPPLLLKKNGDNHRGIHPVKSSFGELPKATFARAGRSRSSFFIFDDSG